MAIYRGGATPVTAIYRGTTEINSVYRGTTLIWSKGGTIHDDFNEEGALSGWFNDLIHAGEFGWGGLSDTLFSDGWHTIVDGFGEAAGYLVDVSREVVSGSGLLVSHAHTDLVEAYCGMWGGTAPGPEGLIGLVNGIPIIGGILADWLSGGDWLGGGDPVAAITSLIGMVPILAPLDYVLGLVPDSTGELLEPINFVTDELGEVIGTVTCGAFTPRFTLPGSVFYVIGEVDGNARMLIPDGLVGLPPQTSRFRHLQTLADDGHVEARVSFPGNEGLITDIFRRYEDNGDYSAGVGIRIRNSELGIVRRKSGNDQVMVPHLGEVTSGDTVRLVQSGNMHRLFRNGIEMGAWNDSGATAYKGAGFRSVGLRMDGAKRLLGPRQFSASLDWLDAA